MSNLNLLEIDTDKLFVDYTIKEIQDIDKKIQSEIEKKRQELRYMVGERYRDVLTAADTIQSMQNSSKSLQTHIHKINEDCYNLHASTRVDEVTPIPVNKQKNILRSVAIQIKILILIPEIIWTCLDVHNYLKAVQIYLLAIHIHTGLELDTENRILKKFPILNRLKLSISLFRQRILDGIKATLQNTKLSPQEASAHLCAYMLLENKTQETALKTLIELRQNSLTTLFNTEVTLHSAVRTRILNLINCLMCTIDLLFGCFLQNNNLIEEQLKTLSENGSVMMLLELEPTPLLEYVPQIVNEFKPSCQNLTVSLKEEIVKNVMDNWMELTRLTLDNNLSKNLEHVTSVKVLHNIREEAIKIETPSPWNQECLELYLPQNFSVWFHYFQPLISKRAEELVRRRIKSNLQIIFKKISSDFEYWQIGEEDLNSFVWTESSEDLGKDANTHEGLAMKTRGVSPRIVALCHTLDQTYSELLQDVSLYLYGTRNGNEIENQTEDGKQLEYYLREESSTSIDKLIDFVENGINKSNNKCVLIGARLFDAISHMCPHLKKCCCVSGDEQQWIRVLEQLTSHSLKFWDYWLHATKINVDKMANDMLIQDITYGSVLHLLPKWDTMEIEEHTEDKIINSEIRLPSQPSISLISLLSAVLSDLNGVVPHTIPKAVHDRFVDNLIEIIFIHYDTLSKNDDVNQNLAIQFLLDVKFITTICVRRESKILMIRSQEICDNLRGKVDPFDLDVFYPHLQGCIKRSVLQMQVFLGCLLGSSNQLSSLGVLEQTNLPISDRDPTVLSYSQSNEVWFPLLPVTAPVAKSLGHTTHIQPQISQTVKPQPERETNTNTFVRSGAAQLLADWFS